MSRIRIVTDSSSDLTADDLDQLDVQVVPLTIRFGDQEFTDGLDLTVADFYSRMAGSGELPQTSCPSPGAFESAFTAASDAGADAVICLTLFERPVEHLAVSSDSLACGGRHDPSSRR